MCVRYSFGQSAIFLIGGTSLEDTPTPMFIHSGDIVIMSGFSRLCYHGVPRIVPAPRTPWDENRTSSACSESSVNSQDKLANICDSWSTISDYIKTSRINLNVRQVSNCSETLLKEAWTRSRFVKLTMTNKLFFCCVRNCHGLYSFYHHFPRDAPFLEYYLSKC